MPAKIAYIVTEEWAFLQHRLPMARAARDAGFEVHVLTRDNGRGHEIEAEGFRLHRLAWQRRRVSPAVVARDVAEVRRVLRKIAPDVVHNVAVKPAVIGSLAAIGMKHTGVVNSIVGLGSAFLDSSLKGRAFRLGLKSTLGALLNRPRTRTIVQNPDDRAALLAAGVRPETIVLVPGSGVDTDRLTPLAEPPPPMRAAYVGRMLEDKGLRALIAAHRILRARGEQIELMLAGEPDDENPTSIPRSELIEWAKEPGIVWPGHVKDIRSVWAACQIAVLPSRREGLPKSLLEAAAFGRPMVATDAAGCREVARAGETGLLVPVDDAAALADALSTLAGDAQMRARMGRNARRLAETVFASHLIGPQTVAVYRAVLEA
jgi:glycosyltransferase involved in cell wall biosynthesis